MHDQAFSKQPLNEFGSLPKNLTAPPGHYFLCVMYILKQLNSRRSTRPWSFHSTILYLPSLLPSHTPSCIFLVQPSINYYHLIFVDLEIASTHPSLSCHLNACHAAWRQVIMTSPKCWENSEKNCWILYQYFDSTCEMHSNKYKHV